MLHAWHIFRAMLHCSYKAWQLTKDANSSIEIQAVSSQLISTSGYIITLPLIIISPDDKLASSAWLIGNEKNVESVKKLQIEYGSDQVTSISIERYDKKAKKLLAEIESISRASEPPIFYKNSHCPQCQFKEACFKKLKERDCISLLGGMSPKILAKYHKKGIFSIMQLSHLFRPRRQRGRPQPAGNFLWELKALAIREQKTYVVHAPNIPEIK